MTNGLFQVDLNFGAGAFNGNPRFLEVRVNGVEMGQRQAIRPAPMALYAFGSAGGSSWSLSGNAGTNANTQFIDTTDNQALELRTRNARSLRIEPSATLVGGLPITANIIAGSLSNEVTSGVRGATISGGGAPEAIFSLYTDGGPHRIGFDFGTVGGGLDNQAGRDAAGEENTFATVGGGLSNNASNFGSTISGGVGNIASGINSIVSGGTGNTASGNRSTVGGGAGNTASGNRSTVSGGDRNCAGASFSWAGGRRAKVRPGSDSAATGSGCDGVPLAGTAGDFGSFVWADSTIEDFVSQRANQFRVRANGGAEFQTGTRGLVAFSNSSASAGAAIQGESVHPDGIAITGRNNSTDATLVLNNGGTGRLIRAFNGGTILMNLENNGNLWIRGALTQNSDRDQKEDIQAVDAQMVLDRLSELQIDSWRYLNGDESVRHIGPMAQDFHAAFGFGVSETTISTIDAQGIAFAAIQALNQRLLASQAEVAVLKVQAGQMRELADRNADLEARLASLEALLLDDRQVAERLQ